MMVMISAAEAESFRRRAVDGEMSQFFTFKTLDKLRRSVAADVVFRELVVEAFICQPDDLTFIVDVDFYRLC